MEKVNSKLFYDNSKNLIKPKSVFRQELVTWEYKDNTIKRTTIIRNFHGEDYIDNYISEPINYQNIK